MTNYTEADLEWIAGSDTDATVSIPLRTLVELTLAARYVTSVAASVPPKRRDESYWKCVEWAQVAYDKGLEEFTRISREEP